MTIAIAQAMTRSFGSTIEPMWNERFEYDVITVRKLLLQISPRIPWITSASEKVSSTDIAGAPRTRWTKSL